MSDVRDPATDQVAPTPNDKPAVWLQVIADMQARHEHGIKKYGTPLQPNNGRNAMRDLYEELLDAAVYAKQKMTEDASSLPGRLRVLIDRWRGLAADIDRRAGETNSPAACIVLGLADVLEAELG